MLKKLNENKLQIIHMLTTAMLVSRIISFVDYFIKTQAVNAFRAFPHSGVTIVQNALTITQLMFPIIILLIISLRTKKLLGDDLKKEWVYFATGVRLLVAILFSIVPAIAMMSFTFVDMREMTNQAPEYNIIFTWVIFSLLSLSTMAIQSILAFYMFKKANKIENTIEPTEESA